jgi:hypothetical protein
MAKPTTPRSMVRTCTIFFSAFEIYEKEAKVVFKDFKTAGFSKKPSAAKGLAHKSLRDYNLTISSVLYPLSINIELIPATPCTVLHEQDCPR